MDRYIESMGDDVVRRFLLPRIPQHTPIEIRWREIRRAIADIFFGGFDKMQKRVRQLLRSVEVPIVKLIGYMLEATGNQRRSWKAVRPMSINPSTVYP